MTFVAIGALRVNLLAIKKMIVAERLQKSQLALIKVTTKSSSGR